MSLFPLTAASGLSMFLGTRVVLSPEGEMKQIAEARRQQFLGEYEDLYGPRLAEMMVQAGHLLEFIVGPCAVGVAFNHFYEQVTGSKPADERVQLWHKAWQEMPEAHATQMAICRDLARLHAEAFYGIVLREDMTLGTWHEDHVARGHINAFQEACPADWWSGGEDLERLLSAHSARHKLDQPDNSGRIWPEELAALARVSLKTIKNVLAPSNRSGLRVDSEGTVGVHDARAWLEARDSFLPSIWLEELDASEDVAALDASGELCGEPVFFPVARDGTAFTPALRRGGHFTIGPKGAEEQVGDFRQALTRLQQMARPSWRRPNEKGHWGIVSAVGWERKASSELADEEDGR